MRFNQDFPSGVLPAFSRSVLWAVGLASLALSGCQPASNSTPVSATATNSSSDASDVKAASSDVAPTAAKTLTVGYSDWPGWVALDIAQQKGFFAKEGVNIQLKFFPVYTDSLNAYAAGQLDGNCQGLADTFPALLNGLKTKAVLMTDYSYGNDALLAQPGINSIRELKGKTVATETGTLEHQLFIHMLDQNGMTEKDVKLVNIAIQDCPAAMLTKRVDAAMVWEPSISRIETELKGAKRLYDSRQAPGFMPALIMFKSDVVAARPKEIQGFVNAWYRAMDWWRQNPKDALKILAKRTDSPLPVYDKFVRGTRILSAPETEKAFSKSASPASLYNAGKTTGEILVRIKQIKSVPDFSTMLEPRFIQAANRAGLGAKPPYDYTPVPTK